MIPPEFHRAEQRLDAVFSKIAQLEFDPELQAHWARYLCVLVSGYMEVSIRAIFSTYAEHKSDARLQSYLERSLNQFQNPSMGRILELARMFDREWANCLEEFSKDAPKGAIDSIVANRHKIAHGENVGISFITIQRYYEEAKKVTHFMADSFL